MGSLEIVETCENCGGIIGKMEKAFVWQERVVCDACFVKLKRNPRRILFTALGIIAVCVIAFGLLGVGASLGWWLRHPAERSVPTSAIPKPSAVPTALVAPVQAPPDKPAQPASMSPNIDLVVTLGDRERLPLPGLLLSIESVDITNRAAKSITINKVLLNGEYEAPLLPVSQKTPIALTIGDSARFMVSTQQHANLGGGGITDFKPSGYLKKVIFVDVFTEAGTSRYQLK